MVRLSIPRIFFVDTKQERAVEEARGGPRSTTRWVAKTPQLRLPSSDGQGCQSGRTTPHERCRLQAMRTEGRSQRWTAKRGSPTLVTSPTVCGLRLPAPQHNHCDSFHLLSRRHPTAEVTEFRRTRLSLWPGKNGDGRAVVVFGDLGCRPQATPPLKWPVFRRGQRGSS